MNEGSKLKVFTCDLLIDGVGDTPIENGMVAVEDSRLIYAGPARTEVLGRYGDAEVRNLKGMTIMPGMIDVHVHLSLDGSPAYLQRMLNETPALCAIKAVNKVRRIVDSGFTTIRTLGDPGQIDIAVKQAIEAGEITGPRLLASGRAITMTGGHGDVFPPHVSIEGMGRIVDGPDEARKAAREQLKVGADNIKVMATGGGMSPGPGTVAQLTIEEMQAAVEEAEKWGKTTAAHAIGRDGIVNALKAGVRTIEHGTFLDEEGIELLLRKKAYLVPTLAAFKTIKYGKEGGVPEYTLEKVRYFATAHYANLKKAIQAGVKVVTGTDAGTPFNYHGESAYELECLVANGLSPMQAIHAATSVAAEALKLQHTGSLASGKDADLIAVEGDPLKDIRLLQDHRRIKMVLKAGKTLKDIL
ncbi:MAG TPA: amidohydrolase family protein [Syntrophobacteraceae bacterium]|nr:amidohydrolase family protein [Syntrophobacteraceae bacterium]